MPSLRSVLLSFSASLLPLLLGGCTASMTTSNIQNPQNPSNPGSSGTTSSSSTVDAYVYVSNQTGANASPAQIVAYSADSNGQLTPVPGSPFNQDVSSLAANGTYLMASANAQPDINTYTIASNGAPNLASQFDYTQETGYQSNIDTVCGYMGDLFFDPTGQSLYAGVGNIQCSNNNAVASFTVNSSSGSLTYLGNTNIGYEASDKAAVLGNDTYAYSALNDSCMYGGISSFARSSTGLLTGILTVTTPPHGPPPPPGEPNSGVVQPSYAAGLTAADTTNHLAIVEYPCFGGPGSNPPVQLATWTAAPGGSLTTTDTYATMPATNVSTPMDMKISPSGTLLAIGGIGGLEVFHFNGASSITAYTGSLTTDSVTQVSWDNDNHLYAITSSSGADVISPGKLYVFTIPNSNGYDGPQQAPGSPYTISAPLYLAVQPQSQ